ncbi:MAG: ribonuclease III [Lachnospiraceae bacterium]|nr:ribonuclease III [Lachnospiraceae bacterium]
MEKSLSLLEKIREEFSLESKDIRTYSPLTLAFVGDCVFDLLIRTVIVERANQAPNQLHQKKSKIVKASAQAALAETLLEELSEEEQAVYKRGRNAKSGTSAKNASIADYRKATGLEALIGFWFLTGQEERMILMVKEGLAKLKISV